MRGYPNKKEYPDWTVEKCTCYTGQPNFSCAYMNPEDLYTPSKAIDKTVVSLGDGTVSSAV